MEHRKNLLDKAIEMRERGERYPSIVAHLRHNCKDEEEVRSIITEMAELEKSGEVKHKKASQFSSINLIGGIGIIAIGCVLMYYSWGKGFIFSLPLVVVALGARMSMLRR